MTPGVLDGIRVLDLGRFIAAPYCGMLLADMGAAVVRVERPGGDEDRSVGLTGSNGENFTYPGLARNKQGITLDIRCDRGRRILFDLVARSDVFLHNYSPGAAAALGIAYDDVRVVRPDVIYTAVSCYGHLGPDADRPGFDPIVQTSSGASSLSGCDGDVPLRCGVPWVDYSTGLCAALATVLALRHRDRTGEGQAVDCALMRTAVSYMAPVVAEAVVLGRPRPRLGNRAAYLGPTDLYRCRDGLIYVACATDSAWRSLMALIGREDLVDAPELRTHIDRFEHRAGLDPLVAEWFGRQTVADAAAALRRAHVPFGIYRAPAELVDDAQVHACGMLHSLDLEAPGLGSVPATGVPFALSRTPGAIRARAPRVGEHNETVYGALLGYDAALIDRLRDDGVI